MLGMLNTIGQCLSVLAAYIFPSSESPRYYRGTTINTTFSFAAACACLATSAWLRRENARRDEREGRPVPGKPLNVMRDFDRAQGASCWLHLREES